MAQSETTVFGAGLVVGALVVMGLMAGCPADSATIRRLRVANDSLQVQIGLAQQERLAHRAADSVASVALRGRVVVQRGRVARAEAQTDTALGWVTDTLVRDTLGGALERERAEHRVALALRDSLIGLLDGQLAYWRDTAVADLSHQLGASQAMLREALAVHVRRCGIGVGVGLGATRRGVGPGLTVGVVCRR